MPFPLRSSLPGALIRTPIIYLWMAAPALAQAPDGLVTVHRSIMADGRVVIGDRPEPGAVHSRVLTTAAASDAEAVRRARQERDAWRGRADAFAQRQIQRQLADAAVAEAARRDRAAVPVDMVVGLHAPLVLARPRPVLNHTGEQPVPFYGSSPGAAAGRAGPPGVGASGAPGAAAGSPSGFIGSGFGTAR